MISVPANQNATLTRIPSRQILASQTVMPCQPNCEVHRLNLELQIIKTDKIQTLTEMLQVTKDLGRTNRNRRNEIPRIERKLRITIEALDRIEVEISRGCPACRQL
mgnify:FL=1